MQARHRAHHWWGGGTDDLLLGVAAMPWQCRIVAAASWWHGHACSSIEQYALTHAPGFSTRPRLASPRCAHHLHPASSPRGRAAVATTRHPAGESNGQARTACDTLRDIYCSTRRISAARIKLSARRSTHILSQRAPSTTRDRPKQGVKRTRHLEEIYVFLTSVRGVIGRC